MVSDCFMTGRQKQIRNDRVQKWSFFVSDGVFLVRRDVGLWKVTGSSIRNLFQFENTSILNKVQKRRKRLLVGKQGFWAHHALTGSCLGLGSRSLLGSNLGEELRVGDSHQRHWAHSFVEEGFQICSGSKDQLGFFDCYACFGHAPAQLNDGTDSQQNDWESGGLAMGGVVEELLPFFL